MAMAQNKTATHKHPASQGSLEGVSGGRPPAKQAKVSASARPRPHIALETPVGAFPVAGVNVNVERRESTTTTSTTALEPPPRSPVLIHKQPNGSNAARLTNRDAPPPAGGPIRFSFATTPTTVAAEWRPTLSLDFISPGSAPATLRTVEVFSRPELSHIFHLESDYIVRASLPRSFYSVMASNGIKHSFVLSYPVGNKWWDDLFGMRKSTYIEFKSENSTVQWELHLKPTKDRSSPSNMLARSIFGYVIKHDDLANMINNQKINLLRSRRLPLVLDLDDTLVRLVGNERSRYVSEADAARVPERVRRLQDGRQVVLTEYVEEFLEWASRLFEISVCSLGDQTYVDHVTDVLDPLKTRIRGARYSARQEYDFLNAPPPSTSAPVPSIATTASGSKAPPGETITTSTSQEANSGTAANGSTASGISYVPVTALSTAAITNAVISGSQQPPLPPKDLLSLYAFCAATKPPTDGLPEVGNGFGLPLILDDLTQMWPPEQHDNVIVVKERRDCPVWTVNLFPMVQYVLGAVHQEFFRSYDTWTIARAAAVASIIIPSPSSSTADGTTAAFDTAFNMNGVNAHGSSGSNTTTSNISSSSGLTAIDFTATTAAKTAFLNMPIPSAIGCYKDWLRGNLRDLISTNAAHPPAHLTSAVAQQHQVYQQQQAQQQQQVQAQQQQQVPVQQQQQIQALQQQALQQAHGQPAPQYAIPQQPQ
ncbi:hypothetical protein BGX28_008772 [Mortierella sp. GBA30]|nr:hypothetical protein BGX28_008772 [Mortierella sp. GBA30]